MSGVPIPFHGEVDDLDTYRGGPVVETQGPGHGPYGSWNDEENAGLDHVASDLPGMIDSGTAKELLEAAFVIAKSKVTYVLADAFGDKVNEEEFMSRVIDYADDLMEQALGYIIKQRQIVDIDALSPRAAIRFLDYIQQQDNTRQGMLEELLVSSYTHYLKTLALEA